MSWNDTWNAIRGLFANNSSASLWRTRERRLWVGSIWDYTHQLSFSRHTWQSNVDSRFPLSVGPTLGSEFPHRASDEHFASQGSVHRRKDFSFAERAR